MLSPNIIYLLRDEEYRIISLKTTFVLYEIIIFYFLFFPRREMGQMSVLISFFLNSNSFHQNLFCFVCSCIHDMACSAQCVFYFLSNEQALFCVVYPLSFARSICKRFVLFCRVSFLSLGLRSLFVIYFGGHTERDIK